MTGSRIGILGCGYVGLELARQLDSEDVYGVRRSESGLKAVRKTGARAVKTDLTDPQAVESLPDADVLVFSASTGGSQSAETIYNDALGAVIETFGERESPPDRLLYTSSTGVYGDHDGAWVDEETPIEPETARQTVLHDAEQLVRTRAPEMGIDGTVVRFGGLYGPDRYRLDRYLEGPVTEGYLNLIHRADAAGVLKFLIKTGQARNDTVLAVDEEPLDRWAFAEWLAAEVGVESPPKETIEERLSAVDSERRRQRIRVNKRCSNRKLLAMGYEFTYPTAYEGYRPAIQTVREGKNAE